MPSPTVRAAAHTSTGASATTTSTVVMPASAAAGDLAVLVVMGNVQTAFTLNNPGWTPLSDTQMSVGGGAGWAWARRLTGTEAGTNLTVAGAGRSSMAVIVLADAGDFAFTSTVGANPNTTTFTIPAITPAAAGSLLLEVAPVQHAQAAPVGVNTPSGWTEQVDRVSTNTSSPMQGVYIATRQGPTPAAAVAEAVGSTLTASVKHHYTIAVAPPAVQEQYAAGQMYQAVNGAWVG